MFVWECECVAIYRFVYSSCVRDKYSSPQRRLHSVSCYLSLFYYNPSIGRDWRKLYWQWQDF